MTEPNQTPDDIPVQEIEFHGRQIWVRMPSPEQLLVWKRTLRQLQGADTAGWNGEQAMAALERVRKIIDSVLAHKADIDWLDDEMLEGTLGLAELAPMVTLTVDAFASAAAAEGNRETKRATKRAVRKAPRKVAPK